MKSVIIPEKVTSIGCAAFLSAPLESVTLPTTVKGFSLFAFASSFNKAAGSSNIRDIIFVGSSREIEGILPLTFGYIGDLKVHSENNIAKGKLDALFYDIKIEYIASTLASSTDSAYSISVTPAFLPVSIENGCTISADKTEMKSGETVTLTITPPLGYAVGSVHAIDKSTTTISPVEVTPTEAGMYTFVMPETDVIITAEFTPVERSVTYNIINGASINETKANIAQEFISETIRPNEGYDATVSVTITVGGVVLTDG